MKTIKIAFRRPLSVLVFLTIAISALAQGSAVVTLHGKVYDSSNGEALFYSSVNLEGTKISNISNSEGVFSLKIPADTPADAHLLISHLGYMTESVALSAFKESTAEKPLEVKLVKVALTLDAATVRAIDAKALFLSAFYKVRSNYPLERVGMTAFYREMIKKGSSKYLALNEAVLDIDKAQYTNFAFDKVGIYKGRGNVNYELSDTLIVKLQGGVVTALALDIAKSPFVGVSLQEAETEYEFSMGDMTTYDDHNFFVVNFDQKPGSEDVLYRGRIFIEEESLAIGRVEFSQNFEGREAEAARSFILRSAPGMRYEVTKADYVISYKNYDDLWYYDYCRVDFGLSARKNKSPFRSTFTVTEEMAVTDHFSGGIAILPANRIKFKDILSERVIDFEDEGFWEDYNIIEPDQDIDVLVKKIVRQLNRRTK